MSGEPRSQFKQAERDDNLATCVSKDETQRIRRTLKRELPSSLGALKDVEQPWRLDADKVSDQSYASLAQGFRVLAFAIRCSQGYREASKSYCNRISPEIKPQRGPSRIAQGEA